MALVETLAVQHGLVTVNADTIDVFLAASPESVAVLFFPGDPARMLESNDVATVLPQLLAAFPGRLRGAVVELSAQTALMPRFAIRSLPSLAFQQGDRALGVIARMQDWSVYIERIGMMLAQGDAA